MELVCEAETSGATGEASCEILELSLRTIQRWKMNPLQGDQRKGPIAVAANSLTDEEEKMIIATVTSAKFQDLSPWQIVSRLADAGQYLASESSFYRVMNKNKLLAHRSKSQPRKHKRPLELIARKPNEVWSWDITYLKSPIKGMYYYLYLMEDVFSRMIVGWNIEEVESAEHAARLIDDACDKQGISKWKLTLHSDNGGPMKGATMLATLQRLGVLPSFSRPSVSDDNPYSESLFKTLKYRPSYPDSAFASLEEASEWVRRFVEWYNTEHLHSGIKFITPASRHYGNDKAILQNREKVYAAAKAANPMRWSGPTRNWTHITEVRLNPGKKVKVENEMLRNQAA
jgi:transposase InsO family protein